MVLNKKSFYEFLHNYRFALLTLALILNFIVIHPKDLLTSNIMVAAATITLMLASINLINKSKKGLRSILLIFCLAIFIFFIFLSLKEVDPSVETSLSKTSYIILYSVLFIFFTFIAFLLYREIYRASKISMEVIVISFCGYFLFGTIGSFIFSLIEIVEPGSFSGLNDGFNKFQDIYFYSFITLTTIGYGDITPLSPMARTFSVLLIVFGQYYMTVIVAILVIKYTSGKEKSITE
ncbi:ion channel [Aureibacter tunicatorum]|uniref:Cobalt/nickel transport system permease protein n=1 Tax=Aureibacter tunicatorum TaxID=866807 RepID=A0AAE3XQC9_9BACT|nr:ion channel [Aureibacter tunicatorum]MDR6240120.1 cobalt/nickel transport system permease protein [Aureibacter tunicatorum]BDD05999.1 hypothetical protein AUTU_34820 [Aureibacter tunicatorum]